MPPESGPTELKQFFDEARYRALADDLDDLAPGFDRERFLRLTLEGLSERTLMERMRRAAEGVDAALPGTFREKLAVLRQLGPRIKHGFVSIFLPEFVALAGGDDFDASMDALRFFTRFGSSEFGVRAFLGRDQERTLAVMQRWALDPDEHIRRLASEGCRPRLPWGCRLPGLVRDPSPLAPIVDLLKDDRSPYVQRSVANNLNDIAKDHPEWVLLRIESWDLAAPGLAWIAHRALRTLVKRGEARALAIFGAGKRPKIRATLTVRPHRLKLGSEVRFSAVLESTARRAQRLVIDYVVHYVRANGRTSPKVFKWRKADLARGGILELTRRQTIRDFTTRKHRPGRHRVALQVNGVVVAEAAFVLAAQSR